MSKTFAFVFARGGSKSLPRKNILSIGGIPLLAHGIRLANQLQDVDKVYVSTDCKEIASIAQKYDAEVIVRPSELATDSSSEWLAWQHAIEFVSKREGSFDRFLSLPASAPLRGHEDVEKCLDALQPGVDMVITISPGHRNPWFNMVTQDSGGIVNLIAGDGRITRRQDSPVCFDITTVAYVARPAFIFNSSSMWDGVVTGVVVPCERSIDIDTYLDFAIARFLKEEYISN